jgi:hypothetical protein
MAKIGGLAETLRVATAGLEPQAAAKKMADFARRERDRVLQAHQSRAGVAPAYTTAVNGRLGASEDTVVPPGPIVYTFDLGAEIGAYAEEFFTARAPKQSGEYSKSLRAIVAGRYVPLASVSIANAFTLVAIVPYARKIEVGAMKMRVPPHVIEDLAQALRRRYGNVATFRVTYIELAGGYVLKGRGKSARARKRAGQPMRYPAIQVTPR